MKVRKIRIDNQGLTNAQKILAVGGSIALCGLGIGGYYFLNQAHKQPEQSHKIFYPGEKITTPNGTLEINSNLTAELNGKSINFTEAQNLIPDNTYFFPFTGCQVVTDSKAISLINNGSEIDNNTITHINITSYVDRSAFDGNENAVAVLTYYSGDTPVATKILKTEEVKKLVDELDNSKEGTAELTLELNHKHVGSLEEVICAIPDFNLNAFRLIKNYVSDITNGQVEGKNWDALNQSFKNYLDGIKNKSSLNGALNGTKSLLTDLATYANRTFGLDITEIENQIENAT
ncbi:MAG: hypothetical protein ACPLYW_00850, partial [Candidatus Nanoarchaeia archaeon]